MLLRACSAICHDCSAAAAGSSRLEVEAAGCPTASDEGPGRRAPESSDGTEGEKPRDWKRPQLERINAASAWSSCVVLPRASTGAAAGCGDGATVEERPLLRDL